MIKIKYIDDESGIALVIALVVLLALTVLGISSMTTSTLDIQMSGNERRAAEALNLADAGVERGVHDLLYDYKHDPGIDRWANNNFYKLSLTTGAQVTNTLAGNFGDFDADIPSQFGTPFSASNIGGNPGNAVAPYGVEDLGSGKYRVLILRDASKPDEVYFRSYAEHSTGARKIIQVHLKMNKIDVWQNAVFAGRGSASAAITGNINVAGSVHVLGTGDINEYTISGNAGVFNGYNGMGVSKGGTSNFTTADLVGRIDLTTLDTVTIAGSEVYTLNSEFRAKNVNVTVSGAGTIGDAGGGGGLDPGIASYAGLNFKSLMDGIYANEGITGSSYYADNKEEDGTVPDYDLGDKIQMPSFEDPYIDDAGTTWDTYQDYIETESLTMDKNAACNLIPGVTSAFINGDSNDDGVCTEADGNCVKWDPGTGSKDSTIEIAGRVKFDSTCGNTEFQIGEGNDVITYKGKGLIYGGKDMLIRGSLVTDDAGGDKFIRDSLMGLLTPGNMKAAEGGGDANAIIMAGIFASEMFSTENPSQIIGTVVSDLFCLGGTEIISGEFSCKDSPGGGQASDIFYVPEMSEEITKLGMIKGRLVFTFSAYEWEQVF
jgi:hypothetical protein